MSFPKSMDQIDRLSSDSSKFLHPFDPSHLSSLTALEGAKDFGRGRGGASGDRSPCARAMVATGKQEVAMSWEPRSVPPSLSLPRALSPSGPPLAPDARLPVLEAKPGPPQARSSPSSLSIAMAPPYPNLSHPSPAERNLARRPPCPRQTTPLPPLSPMDSLPTAPVPS